MEELRKLEKVQRMVEFMESRGVSVSTSDHHSNRFLANLMLFLIEPPPCGSAAAVGESELGMDHKCRLVSHLMPTLSSSFLEDAQQHLVTEQHNTGFQQNHGGNALLSCSQKKERSLLPCCNENMAMVSLDSMEKANSTLEDFCRSYFMFHGLDVSKPQSIFKYLPILSFTESYIYQLDKMNEKLQQTPATEDEKATHDLVSCFSNDPVGPLVTIFEHKGLLTGRIKDELRLGEEYWALERKLCHAMTNKEEILVDDVMKAIHLKSFDYRVLNLLLYELRGAKVEDLHMEFLSVSEFLVEVSDDLLAAGMTTRIYGASTAPAMLAKCISEAENKYESLLELLDPQLSMNYQKRCAEATKEGGRVSENPLGTWSIPAVIQDEELYRSMLKSHTS
ncbi:uncharacterized protein LOC130723380 isoform X2 [Lotus japonicus]|uniref:uncharacterized protein LOC130723380 isoform X2 n=1 Tax=Lotus japonicus TaxID=34305 RepID=UPI00258B14D3|nr:uncharacterized protein LOC130723380 isoform X2 [Lotus japonicus]